MAGKKQPTTNPLVSNKASDTAFTVQLHPLVLLTISDYITRHTLRNQQGPVVGAIIGQQNGHNYTLEHAYECKLAAANGSDSKEDDVLDRSWFEDRLEQYQEVHNAPSQLDLVGMFMLAPQSGPQEAHLPVLKQVQEMTGTDNVLLLLFHPESKLVSNLQGGKLPITLYESFSEASGESGENQIRFREVDFEVETGEAEMIGVDFVAKGGGNATAIPGSKTEEKGAGPSKEKAKETRAKGKGKAKEEDETNGVAANVLSAEDEELIAGLTAKANAIKMLTQRINLIRSYLKTLPNSYLTDADEAIPPADTTNHALLRSVASLLSRLPLLAPPTPTLRGSAPSTSQAVASPLQLAVTKEREDVHLTSLLAALTRSISEAQSLGSRFSVVQREKQNKQRSDYGTRAGGGLSRGGMGFGDESGLLAAGEGGY